MRVTEPYDEDEDADFGEYDEVDWDAPLTEPPSEQASPLIVGGAVVGLLVGLFLWGSLMLSAASGVFGIFDDSSPTGSESSSGGVPVVEEQTELVDCDAFGPGRALSPEQEAAYLAQCQTPTPEPEAETTPVDASLNREDCASIRGTEYRSPEERQWFLANCVN